MTYTALDLSAEFPNSAPLDDSARRVRALAAELFDRARLPGAAELTQLRAAAIDAARAGTALSVLVRACHEGVRRAFDRRAAGLPDAVSPATVLALDLLAALSAAIADAYLDAHCLAAREQQTAAQTLASALLGGRGGAALARQTGVRVASAYQVVALAIAEHPRENGRFCDVGSAEHARLRLLHDGLARLFDGRALNLLGARGGTLLIPADAAALTPETLTELAGEAGVALTAALVTAEAARVPEAADQAHELLELVRASCRPPGLYQMSDLAVEYQLTRGGPATRRLAAILEPLDAHPELFDTARAYLGNDMNRQLTARQLYIHPNTVDYRLRRIAQLSGIDLATASGISQAAIALLARDLDLRSRSAP
ncbi:PucR family transcriptional regulator [Nocardia panacis]|uniref:PucR family transcriptional regulator n=1 Tax=Nocardia panacis TaxID=2340916 RepID=A0A3A4JTW1_9NOCA|nr:helix-turn-helix domain-containing protein [Nocardia panacis]RJO73446.1 PucR family transcriptional regulator [Nocardia panacis]